MKLHLINPLIDPPEQALLRGVAKPGGIPLKSQPRRVGQSHQFVKNQKSEKIDQPHRYNQ